ncbi:MAG TPA: signal recognition particle-docking protein FtsY [Gammaproteobacteria bacterium]|nr:signal recognition particle-docking protein FtsY [Gammaproteobacteria bacterium]
MLGFRKSRPADQAADDPRRGGIRRLWKGLGRTRENLTENLANALLGRKEVDEALVQDLEDHLLLADVGVEATERIIEHLNRSIRRREAENVEAVRRVLGEAMGEILAPCVQPFEVPAGRHPFVILMVGVNGVGKTTTIAKLAARFRAQGLSVILAAGDTFRAAAVQQLQIWGERNRVAVVAQHTGADPASVVYDALQAAQARGTDVLIADTAGRLHTQGHLMEELRKIKRVISKLDAEAPHEVMLVVDAGTGQNALAQAEQFNEAVGLTGITLTKLDGTARGGIIFALAERMAIPIRFVGVGESAEDLRPFDAEEFIEALLTDETEPAGAPPGQDRDA